MVLDSMPGRGPRRRSTCRTGSGRPARGVGCATPVGTTAASGVAAGDGLAVDQQAALVGEGCLSVGQAKSPRTGAFLLVTTGTGATAPHTVSASVAWEVPGSVSYCLDGQSYTAGRRRHRLVAMGLAPLGRGSRCRRHLGAGASG